MRHDDGAGLEPQALQDQSGVDGFKYLWSQLVLLQQIPKSQDSPASPGTRASQSKPSEATMQEHLAQFFLNGAMMAAEPLRERLDSSRQGGIPCESSWTVSSYPA